MDVCRYENCRPVVLRFLRSMIELATRATVLLNCICFAFAFKFYFRATNKMSLKLASLNVVGAATVISSILIAIIQKPTGIDSLVIEALLVISFCIFVWALLASRKAKLGIAFGNLQSQSILTAGPYRFVRHPFYLSYSITWLAVWLYSFSLIHLVLSFTLVILYFVAAQDEEASLSRGKYAEIYIQYKNRTGMFFPKLNHWRTKHDESRPIN